MLKMIQTDIIHEDQHENDSADSDDKNRGNSSDENEEEFLDPYDQRVLRDRILHAIKVFSKWSPNPKKEIMKHQKTFKLSIEDRSSKNSERSFSLGGD